MGCNVRQLSGLDNSFLSMETPSQYGHVASMTVYDLTNWKPSGGATSFFEALLATVNERLHLLPVMRRKLVEVPFGLDHPYWIEDPDFDIEFHVRNLALPAPGNEVQLAEQVARISSRPLDRARPLWEIYIIDGLANNRAAMLTKIHHATIDGVQGVEMLTTLLDEMPEGRTISPPRRQWRPEQAPSTVELMARTALTWSRNPAKAARLSAKAAQSALGIARSGQTSALLALPLVTPIGSVPVVGDALRRLSGRSSSSEKFPAFPTRPAPKTPFNKSITPHRKYAYKSLSIDDAKFVRRIFGTTLNDVVLAISAGALRRYLTELGELPAEPMIAMVPVSVRSGKEADSYSNRVSAMLANLHTHVEDPVERLKAINESMKAGKGMSEAIPADLMTDLAHFAPPAVAARASRLMTRTGVMNRISPPFNLVISNVPGPAVALYTSGAKLEHFYPVSTIVDGQGMNITVQSYMSTLDFGVITCRELVPDAWVITDYIADALDELVAAARKAEDTKRADSPVKLKSVKAG
jgi:diacylglycerol O-acyltransferase / wax synthase